MDIFDNKMFPKYNKFRDRKKISCFVIFKNALKHCARSYSQKIQFTANTLVALERLHIVLQCLGTSTLFRKVYV